MIGIISGQQVVMKLLQIVTRFYSDLYKAQETRKNTEIEDTTVTNENISVDTSRKNP